MEKKLNEKVFQSNGSVQILLKNYYSNFTFLFTVEEGYSETGLSRPVLIIEEGVLKRERTNTTFFTVENARFRKVCKDLKLRKKDEDFLVRRLGRRKVDSLLNFLYREEQKAKRYNNILKGKVNANSKETLPI